MWWSFWWPYQKSCGAGSLVDSSDQRAKRYPMGRRSHGAVRTTALGASVCRETEFQHRFHGSRPEMGRWLDAAYIRNVRVGPCWWRKKLKAHWNSNTVHQSQSKLYCQYLYCFKIHRNRNSVSLELRKKAECVYQILSKICFLHI